MKEKTSHIIEDYGIAAVEGAKEIGDSLKEDLAVILEGDSNIENDAIEFYLTKLYDNFDVYLVISHPIHPTEEQSVDLLFKVIDRIEKDNIFRAKNGTPTVKYERSYNKLKVTWNL